jgi:hypothetical protein
MHLFDCSISRHPLSTNFSRTQLPFDSIATYEWSRVIREDTRYYIFLLCTNLSLDYALAPEVGILTLAETQESTIDFLVVFTDPGREQLDFSRCTRHLHRKTR